MAAHRDPHQPTRFGYDRVPFTQMYVQSHFTDRALHVNRVMTLQSLGNLDACGCGRILATPDLAELVVADRAGATKLHLVERHITWMLADGRWLRQDGPLYVIPGAEDHLKAWKACERCARLHPWRSIERAGPDMFVPACGRYAIGRVSGGPTRRGAAK